MPLTVGDRRVLERFFQRLVDELPERSTIVATDATGYSGRKRSWRETKHAWRASEDWVKVHATVEVNEFVVLSYTLADSAYVGEACLAAARQHGAVPLHAIKKNAHNYERPRTPHQKLVNSLATGRTASLYAKLVHAETVFSMISTLLGCRLRCRSERGRKNEVHCKLALFNLIQLVHRKEFWS